MLNEEGGRGQTCCDLTMQITPVVCYALRTVSRKETMGRILIHSDTCCEVYTGVIAACGTQGKYDTVRGLLSEMQQLQVQTNTVVLNAAMSAFIKCGALGDAYQIYYDMSNQQVRPDLETYNALMQSFVQQSYWEGALQTLETIRSASQDPDSWAIIW